VSPTKHSKLLTNRLLLTMLVGAVLMPALLSFSVGVVALALWQESFGLVFGVLTLTFAATAIAGGVFAFIFARRSGRLGEMQADFVANVSHELRTPLSGIRLVTESLEAGLGEDPVRRKALVEMLGDEMRHLEDLVQRVLLWRQIEEGLPAPPREVIPVAELVQEAVLAMKNIPEAQTAELRRDVAPDLPPLVGDRVMLVHALANLLHNSVKFAGRDGPIEVTARQDGDAILVTVKDQGHGIERADQKRIFDRFYRAPEHRTTHPGTGLGLAIVKSVVASHKGHLLVQSTPGAGAVFTMVLPVPKAMRRG